MAISKSEQNRRWYLKNKETKAKNNKKYREANPKKMQKLWTTWRDSNREKFNAYKREYDRGRRLFIKETVFTHYSKGKPKCSCCGIKGLVFLTIDHINGGGNKHRENIKKRAGTQFYRWLMANGYPKGYEVLCFNCNFAKSSGEKCPHK